MTGDKDTNKEVGKNKASETKGAAQRQMYAEAAEAFKNFAERKQSSRKRQLHRAGDKDTHFFLMIKDGTLSKHLEYFQQILMLAKPEMRGQREIIPDVEVDDEMYMGDEEEFAAAQPVAESTAGDDEVPESDPAKAFFLSVGQQFQLVVTGSTPEDDDQDYTINRLNWLFDYDIPYQGKISISFNRAIPESAEFVAGIKAYFTGREFSKVGDFSSNLISSLYVFFAFAIHREYERRSVERVKASRFTASITARLSEFMDVYGIEGDKEAFKKNVLIPAIEEINNAEFGKFLVTLDGEEDGDKLTFTGRFNANHPLVVHEGMAKLNPMGEQGYVVSKEYLLQSEFPYNGVPSADDVGIPAVVVSSGDETFSVEIMDDSRSDDEDAEVIKFSKVTRENVGNTIYSGLLQYFPSAEDVLYYFQSKAATQELQRIIKRYDMLSVTTVNRIRAILASEEG